MFRTNYQVIKRTIAYYIQNDFEFILTQCCQKATSGWKGLNAHQFIQLSAMISFRLYDNKAGLDSLKS